MAARKNEKGYIYNPEVDIFTHEISSCGVMLMLELPLSLDTAQRLGVGVKS